MRRHFLESDVQGQLRRKKQFPHGLHAMHQPAAYAIELVTALNTFMQMIYHGDNVYGRSLQ